MRSGVAVSTNPKKSETRKRPSIRFLKLLIHLRLIEVVIAKKEIESEDEDEARGAGELPSLAESRSDLVE